MRKKFSIFRSGTLNFEDILHRCGFPRGSVLVVEPAAARDPRREELAADGRVRHVPRRAVHAPEGPHAARARRVPKDERRDLCGIRLPVLGYRVPSNSSKFSTAVKSNSFPTMLGPSVFAPRVLDDFRERPYFRSGTLTLKVSRFGRDSTRAATGAAGGAHRDLSLIHISEPTRPY